MRRAAMISALLALTALSDGTAIAAGRPSAKAARLVAQVADETSNRVLVAAHRGAHKNAPENSIASIKDAIALGVDIAEIDIRVTRDGVPVLMHDATVDATTDGSGPIEQMTFDQVRKLRLKARRGKEPGIPLTDQRVPSLQEALRVARGRILVDLDIKTDQIAPVIETVNAVEAGAESLWFDSRPELLDQIVAHGETVVLMPRAYELKDVQTICARYPATQVIHIDSSFFTPEVVRTIKACGARVWMNALGDVDKAIAAGGGQAALAPLLQGGANVIQTDEPEALLGLLRAAGRRR